MHQLRSAAQEIDGLAGFIEAVTSISLTQGVVVDLNPFWLAAYQLQDAGLDPAVIFRALEDSREPDLFLSPVSDLIAVNGFADLQWSHQLVDFLTARVFGPEKRNRQFLVKAIAIPVMDPELRDQRRALSEIVSRAPFSGDRGNTTASTLVLARGDPCVAVSGARGTVRGFLHDRHTGRDCAATCGHVAQIGPVSVHGNMIGMCTHSTPPIPLPPGQLCTTGNPYVTRLDLALIDVTGTTVTNATSAIAQAVYPSEAITAAGGSTGVHRHEVGGACMLYRIGGSCFANLFEVRPPATGGVVSPRLRASIATVPKLGDSGAWVERVGAPDWCGVEFAADHLMGYAMEADTITTEANAVFNMDLVPR